MLSCKKYDFTPVFDDRSSFRAKGLSRHTQNRNFTSVFGDRSSFRAKGLSRHTQNRNFIPVFGDRSSFRAKGLSRHTQNRNFTFQFLAIEALFVRKGCRGTLKIAILLFSFWRSKLFSCERVVAAHSKSQFYFGFWRKGCVSCRLVGTAPRLKREIEKKEKEEGKRARGQESKRASENVKM